MCKALLFVDMEFPRGGGDQMEKSWKFQGVGGGMDIFWNHTIHIRWFSLLRSFL